MNIFRRPCRGMTRVFVDTSALKAAHDSQLLFLPRRQILDWGHTKTEVTVHDLVYHNQNVRLREKGNESAFRNRTANRFVARLAAERKIQLVVSDEVCFEAMGVPRVDFTYFNAPLGRAISPAMHAGMTIDGSGVGHLHNALCGIRDKRFVELQKLAGAYQGADVRPQRNQLLDAYHIWTGEVAGADYLLTHDEKLVRMWKSSRRAGSCQPIDAEPLIRQLLTRNPSFIWVILKEARHIRRSGRRLGARFQNYSEVNEDFSSRI